MSVGRVTQVSLCHRSTIRCPRCAVGRRDLRHVRLLTLVDYSERERDDRSSNRHSSFSVLLRSAISQTLTRLLRKLRQHGPSASPDHALRCCRQAWDLWPSSQASVLARSLRPLARSRVMFRSGPSGKERALRKAQAAAWRYSHDRRRNKRLLMMRSLDCG